MAYRIAINGFGRIGRSILRALYESTNYSALRIVAINDVADIETLAHLTRYDSTHGRFIGTGAFSDRANADQHLKSGAHRVLFSQPAESDVDATLVYGINHETLSASASIVSNASCTTNCIVPVLKALDDSFGLQSGAITTIHSAMNDQPVIDGYHNSDLRRTRSAMQSIIPVNTELARGIERILPNLSGLLEAQAIRVPTVNVSAMDLTVTLAQKVTVEQVNNVLREYSEQLPANVLGVSDELLASCDYNHDPRSAVVDSNQTRVAPNNLVKLLVWFDNEWAYANRMLDVAQFMSEQ